MEERSFLDKNYKPTDETLKAAFGDSYVYYEGLMDVADSFFKGLEFLKKQRLDVKGS